MAVNDVLFIFTCIGKCIKRSALQLFEHYYQGLMCSLHLNDTNFMEDLSKHNLLPEKIENELKELSKHKERASYFLDHVIKPGLVECDDTNFINLLTVMKNSQCDSVTDLAELIESEYYIIVAQGIYVSM